MSRREILGERDERLFDLLYRFKVATIEDIRDLVFNGVGKCHVYRRLKELILLGQIQKVFAERNGKYLTAYSLTRSSFKRVLPQGKDYQGQESFLSDKILHDLGILTLYRRLSQSPRIADFLTENVLKSDASVIDSYGIREWIKQRPDAILIDHTPNGRYFLPLECELSTKRGFRYETKLMGYYQSEKIPAVIYICGSAKLMNSIIQVEEKYCHAYRPKVFYGLMDQCQPLPSRWPHPPGHLVFTNRRKGQIAL